MNEFIIGCIIGVFGGFTIAILISYMKILNRDTEIKLLKNQNNKYKDFIDNHQFYYDKEFEKKESKDENTK